MSAGRTVIVVGGSGGFGERLVRGLAAHTNYRIVVAGRTLARCAALAQSVNNGLPHQRLFALQIDARTVGPDALRECDAFLVVDASGPFQQSDFNLARTAIVAGLHYVDLADDRGFVSRIATLDDAAKAAGVAVISGASSTPAISAAVLDELTAGWQVVESVEVGISPGNRAAPRGLSVIQSILSYAGRPVRVFVNGGWTARMGWGVPCRRFISGLGRRWFSLCETPDLDILPTRYGVKDRTIFRGGLELSVFHLGLFVLGATLVASGILRSLLPLSRLMQKAATALGELGSPDGGMIVAASGLDADGGRVSATWTLVATDGDGPFIPTLPALATIRALAENRLEQSGAYPCVGVLALDAIEREFTPYRIRTHMESQTAMHIPSPFERLLGNAFDELPPPVKRFHGLRHAQMTAGKSEVIVARGMLPRLICLMFGLPRAGSDVSVTVFFQPDGKGHEFWQRHFAGRRYQSTMDTTEKAGAKLLVERFWPFRLHFKLTPDRHGIDWLLVGWSLFRLPLPHWVMPRVKCRESGEGDRFTFDIDFAVPLIGPVIHYNGWLEAT